MTKDELLKEVKYDKNGLVVVVCQDYHSKKVRMVAYMNEEALTKTLATKEAYYFSRSRNELWHKGETSGCIQYVKGISIDCDGDALLLSIEQKNGISCHTGNSSCFYRDLEEESFITINRGRVKGEGNFLSNLYNTIDDRKKNPVEGSYTNYLLDKGINKILKKVGEEASEVIIAAKDNSNTETVFEIADLMYHLSVMMSSMGITWDDVALELEKRE